MYALKKELFELPFTLLEMNFIDDLEYEHRGSSVTTRTSPEFDNASRKSSNDSSPLDG